jgi:hypothetical protein
MHTPCSPRRMSIKGSCILRKQEESCQVVRGYLRLNHHKIFVRPLCLDQERI